MRPAPSLIVLLLSSVFLASTLAACGGDSNPLVPLPNPTDDESPDTRDESRDEVPDIVVPDEPLDIPGCDPTAEDDPDPLGEDTNCDGVDGDAMRSIFVASYGSDDNPGSRQRPKLTIKGGLEAAAADDARNWVIIENGLYQEDVTLINGINVAGGYRFGWERNPRTHAVIRGTNPAVTGKDLTDPTTLMNLEVQVSGNVGPGETSITMLLENSSGVVLENVIVTGGRGGEGRAGQEWSGGLGDGARGNAGRKGSKGVEPGGGLCDKDDVPGGAPETPSVCDASPADKARAVGGKGGGVSGSDNSVNGFSGSAGGGGAPGGRGGQGESSLGLNGSDGARGNPGASGVGGGVFGQFMGTSWQGASGTPGGEGFPGTGGGGGGGGGYNNRGTFLCDATGGTGGAGGSGGCGGKGGKPGQSGGASVSLFLVDSDIMMRDCYIDMGQGGSGGAGAQGGAGGEGGNGGNGGGQHNDSGPGGKGGKGGNGGEGGNGGAGAGGPVFGIYSNVSLAVDPTEDNDFAGGTGGSGGNGSSGSASNGAMGQVVAVQVGPIEDPAED